MAYLDEWSLLEKEHMSSFLGATEALRASTLRLPVVGKATVCNKAKVLSFWCIVFRNRLEGHWVCRMCEQEKIIYFIIN